MHPSPSAPVLSLADAERRYKNAVDAINEAYEGMTSVPPGQVTPTQLDAAIQLFLTTSQQVDRGSADVLSSPEEVSRLGDYGITLLMDLLMWAKRLGLSEIEAEFDVIVLSFADWAVRHGGELRTIEPLVDAFANLANRSRESATLEELTHLMTRIIRATGPSARAGVGQVFPARPWRLLNLNRGIIATRTHNAALMEEVFAELVSNLPDDAREFFAEGMQQMDSLNYPIHVRAVMVKYFDRWTRARMH